MDTSYLSLGDMLTFVGLIIAILQFAKPRYSLIWRLSNKFFRWTAILLLIVGYFSPLLSIVIPSTKTIWDGLSTDQLLQVGGFTAITLGLLIIAYIYLPLNYRHLITSVTKFRLRVNKYPKKKWRSIYVQLERNKIITTRSARKFYKVTSLFLVRGNIEDVVEITRLNLGPLVYSAQQYTSRPVGFPGTENTEKSVEPNGSNYAFETLYQLLTDETVMKHICTNNRFFLHAIVECELANNDGATHNEFAGMLYNNLIEQLVLNPSSYLYTQRDAHNGSARFANVYDLLTDDRIIRRQHIIPSMLTWNVSKADVQLDDYTDVLLKLLTRMIDSYKKQPGGTELLSNIRQLFDQLIGDNGVTRRLAFDKKARKQYADDFITSMGYKVLSKIQLAMTTGLLCKDEDPEIFKNNAAELKSVNERTSYKQTTLTGLMAQKVYELIQDLTIFYQDTDDPDGSLMREAHDYISVYASTPVAKRYNELLWERLFDKAVDGKIEPYSTNIAGYYPNVLRFIIRYLVPFTEYQTKRDPQAVIRLKRIMASELGDVLLADKKMSNDEPMKKVLLPEEVKAVINKKDKTVKYFYVGQNGKKTVLDLDEQKSDPNTRA